MSTLYKNSINAIALYTPMIDKKFIELISAILLKKRMFTSTSAV